MQTGSKVLVRRAQERDMERLISLLGQLDEQSALLDSHSVRATDVWREINLQAGRSLLVAEIGGEMVGTVDCLITPNLTHGGRPYVTVENMVVHSDYRRRGVGAELMAAVFDAARRTGCYKVQLLSNRRRIEAHSFYEAMGFTASAQGYRLYLESA